MEKIIKELSEKYNLPTLAVRLALESQYRFVAQTMRDGEFKSVRLRYLGIFGVKPKRKEMYVDKRKKEK